MFGIKSTFQAASLSLAIACSGLAAEHASAQRGYHQQQDRHVVVERDSHRGHVRVEVSSRSDRHRHDRGQHHRDAHPRHDRRDHHTRPAPRRGHAHAHHRQHQVETCPPTRPRGYWKTVYRPPVYQTICDRWGNQRRVMVKYGYHERVWVAYPRHGQVYY